MGMTKAMMMMQMQMQMCKMNQKMMEMAEESDSKCSSERTPSQPCPPHSGLVLDLLQRTFCFH